MIALSLAGCSRPVSGVPFAVDGEKRALFEGPPKEGGSEGSPLFSLAQPVTIDRAGQAFFLRYPGGGNGLSVAIHLRERAAGESTERVIRAALPAVTDARSATVSGAKRGIEGATSGTSASASSGASTGAEEAEVGRTSAEPSEVELMVPVPTGAALTGFRVEGEHQGGELAIRAAGIAPLGPGVAIDGNLISLRPGFSYAASGGADGKAASRVETFSFAPVTRRILDEQHASQVQIVLTYAFGGADGESGAAATRAGGPAAGGAPGSPAPGRVELTLARGREERSYLLTPNPGEHTVYVYSASCRFSPESLRIDSSDPAFRALTLQVNPFSPERLPAGTPIPADLGTILTYNPLDWRTKDFELFSWSMVPDVLVFDFRSYDVEGDYLSRFAYFIEKKGFRGRLMTTAELKGLRGWNAHDYRPQDIARFYQTAEEEHVALRPQEYRLRDILVENGIIKQVAGRWEPGKGALISVAQSSWYGLRYLLLTHEAFHGIYFTHPAYRAEVHAVWDSLNPDEKLFWRLLFGSQEYDPTDRYLVINEFQAYLMQQPLQAVDARYRDWAVGYVERHFPGEAPLLRRMMAGHPQIFLDTAKKLDAAVYRTAGVHAGELVTLVPRHWR